MRRCGSTRSPRARRSLFLTRSWHRIFPWVRSYRSAHFERFSLLPDRDAALPFSGIHPVHDHVNVRVLRVVVRHDQDLMILQAQCLEAPLHRPAHLLAVRALILGPTQRVVTDWLGQLPSRRLHPGQPLEFGAVRRRRTHDPRRPARVIRGQVPGLGPLDSRGQPASAPGLSFVLPLGGALLLLLVVSPVRAPRPGRGILLLLAAAGAEDFRLLPPPRRLGRAALIRHPLPRFLLPLSLLALFLLLLLLLLLELLFEAVRRHPAESTPARCD